MISTAHSPLAAHQWWRREDLFNRYSCDVIAAELLRQRPQHDFVSRPILATTRLGEDGLALDSLERLRICEALVEALRIEPWAGFDRLLEPDLVSELIDLIRALMFGTNHGPVFHTSGSQGIPRRVRHGWVELSAELDHWQQRFASARRIVSLVPSPHIYGFLFTIALPAMLGIPVMDARGRVAGSVISILERGDLVISHPLFWQMAINRAWPSDISAVTSGGAVDRAAFAQAACDGLDTAIEIYGSTETSGVGVRHAKEAIFTLLPWWDRAGDGVVRQDGKPIALPDEVEWFGPRLLDPTRRKDGQVQVAGTNVSPQKVSSVLCAHPAVAQARVRLMVPHEGNRLKAFIVPAHAGDDLEAELAAWCASRLAPMERPKAFTLGASLPVSPEGKDIDWAIG